MYDNMMLLVNKPSGWSSFDVVKKLRCTLGIKKIGHAGTLDPRATGLLILCTGKKTKEIARYQAMPKVYEGEMELGKTTPSFDLETPFDYVGRWEHITPAMVHDAVKSFIGAIWQTPPIYSAIHHHGERAYKKVRKGEKVVLRPRLVSVKSFTITCALPIIRFTIICGKGVYIRSIAHDLGQKLGVGGFLKRLQRTQIGPYHLRDAYDVDAFTNLHI